jgi:NADH-quinone oxidoreductase subunit I
MVIRVERKQLSFSERLYLPAILSGLVLTFRHVFKKKRTMQYPEQKWQVPPGYRGAPTLVKDENGRERCVACQLCEFVCPPRAIRIVPEEFPENAQWGKIEKRPKEFDIDMIRCIYCGLCEEVCPEQAIFLRQDYSITGYSREQMVHHKEKLYELGGVMPGLVKKWENK